jgi:hypothetical protein
MLAALVLGSLHGECDKSSAYLSNQMPRTISTKPDYSVRFWEKHGLRSPKRDIFALLRDRVCFRYETPPPDSRATVLELDFRDLPRRLAHSTNGLRCVVTSPPYLDTTNFEEDQWLRLWFLGGPPKPTYRRISRDDRYENPAFYWQFIADMWRVLGCTLALNADVVIRLGGKNLSSRSIVDGLMDTSTFARRKVKLISSYVSRIRGRQTEAFRPGSQGCRFEVDCHFRVH